MLLAILSTCSPEELETMEDEEDYDDDDDDGHGLHLALSPSEHAARRQQIKNKILAVGKMQRVFQLLRCVSNAVWSCNARWRLRVVMIWDVGSMGPRINALVPVSRAIDVHS